MADEKIEAEFGSDKCLEQIWHAITSQCILIGEYLPALMKSPPANFPTAYLFFKCVLDSAHSLTILHEHRKARDVTAVFRTLLETLVNAGYIAAGGKAEHDNALAHFRQKTYRLAHKGFSFRNHNVKVGHQGGFQPPADPALQAELDTYTTKRGTERSWPGNSLEQRLPSIEAWMGVSEVETLRYLLFSTYVVSSEIAHGSMYSVFYAIGMVPRGPSGSLEGAEKQQREMLTEFGLYTAGCLSVAAKMICRLVGDRTLGIEVDKVFEDIKEMSWVGTMHVNKDGHIVPPEGKSCPLRVGGFNC